MKKMIMPFLALNIFVINGVENSVFSLSQKLRGLLKNPEIRNELTDSNIRMKFKEIFEILRKRPSEFKLVKVKAPRIKSTLLNSLVQIIKENKKWFCCKEFGIEKFKIEIVNFANQFSDNSHNELAVLKKIYNSNFNLAKISLSKKELSKIVNSAISEAVNSFCDLLNEYTESIASGNKKNPCKNMKFEEMQKRIFFAKKAF